jgi:hypothetical protein
MPDPSAMPHVLSTTAEIRSHLPALERRHNGQPVTYFDSPGGTQVPRQVVEAMNDYLYHHNANVHQQQIGLPQPRSPLIRSPPGRAAHSGALVPVSGIGGVGECAGGRSWIEGLFLVE